MLVVISDIHSVNGATGEHNLPNQNRAPPSELTSDPRNRSLFGLFANEAIRVRWWRYGDI
jgi:hypothetical protein